MEKQKLIDKLTAIYAINRRIEKLEKKITEARKAYPKTEYKDTVEYNKRFKNKQPKLPEKKKIVEVEEYKPVTIFNSPKLKKTLITFIVMCTMIIITYILIHVYFSYSGLNNANDPVWNEWVEKYWNTSSSLEEVSQYWYIIQKHWARKLVFVNWNKVLKCLKKAFVYDSISPSNVLYAVSTYGCSEYITIIIGLLIVFDLSIIYIFCSSNKEQECSLFNIKAYNSKKRKQYEHILEENRKAEEYNINVYPRLIEEYKIKQQKYLSEYNEALQKMLEKQKADQEIIDQKIRSWSDEIKELKQAINNSNVLPKKYQDYPGRLIEILSDCRAHDLESALNVLENDLHLERAEAERRQMESERLRQQQQILQEMAYEREEQRREIERQNREMERHNREMERQKEMELSRQEKHMQEMADLEKQRQKQLDRERKLQDQREEDRRRRLAVAADAYKAAAQNYNIALNLGRSVDASVAKAEMDRLYAEMQKYK